MKFKLNRYFIEDILNSNHPSDFDYTKDYSLLILRLPYIKEEKVYVESYAFLIKDNEVYIFNRKKSDFDKLGGFKELYEYLDIRVDKILAKISKLHMQIAKMEDDLYDNNIQSDFVNQWLYLKKELALIERLMGHSLIAFERFIKYYKEILDEIAFNDLSEHIDRAFRFSKAALEKLDYLYNFYRAKIDEKTNKVMFILTIISAIFLPLTLITGFFGMNTGGLPYTTDSLGTIKATFLAFVFEIPFIIWLWRVMKKG